MDGCLEGCAGCFLQMVIIAVVIALAYVFIGVFWMALIAGIVFAIFWGLGKLTIGWLRKIFKS